MLLQRRYCMVRLMDQLCGVKININTAIPYQDPSKSPCPCDDCIHNDLTNALYLNECFRSAMQLLRFMSFIHLNYVKTKYF